MKAEGGMIQTVTSGPATAATSGGGLMIGTWSGNDVLVVLSICVVLFQLAFFVVRAWKGMKHGNK